MAKFISPGGSISRFRWVDVKGKVLAVKQMQGIRWWVPNQPIKNNRIILQTLPAGNETTANWTTVQDWLDNGEVTVTVSSYPSWTEALAAHPHLMPSFPGAVSRMVGA